MPDSITPWEVGFAVTSGLIEPTEIAPPAGDAVVCLGSSEPNNYVRLNVGDYAEVSQTAEFATTLALVRATFSFRAPTVLPSGVLWRVAIFVNDAEVVGRNITNDGRLVTRFDLATNVSNLGAGDHKIAVRLSLAGVSADDQLVELPGVYIDAFVYDGPTL